MFPKQDITLVVVADQKSARFFVNEGPGTGLKLTHEQKNEHHDRHSHHHADHDSDQFLHGFAREVGKYLDAQRQAHAYQKLLLVAPNRLLGALRTDMPKHVTETITETLDSDLGHANEHEVAKHLKGHVML